MEEKEEDGRAEGKGRICIVQDKPQGIGYQLWPAGVAMANLVLDPSSDLAAMVKGKGVLELGSGCGVVGMAAAMAGASSVTLTDQAEVMPHLGVNLARNADVLPNAASVRAVELSWGWNDDDDGESLSSLGPPAERQVVLLADCIYWESLYDRLICTLIRVCPPSGTCIVAYHVRRSELEGRFFEAASVYFDMEGPQVMIPSAPDSAAGLMFDVDGEGDVATEGQLWMQVMRLKEGLDVDAEVEMYRQEARRGSYLIRHIEMLERDIGTIEGE